MAVQPKRVHCIELVTLTGFRSERGRETLLDCLLGFSSSGCVFWGRSPNEVEAWGRHPTQMTTELSELLEVNGFEW
jgi:hypothetical protein